MTAMLAPVLIGQAVRLRRRTPTLPEATGPRHGSTGASDIALVVLGVNDTLRLTSPSAWRRTVGAIVAELRAVQGADGLVLLAGVPDLGAFTGLPRPLRTVLGEQSRELDRELVDLAGGAGVRHVPTPALDGLEAPFASDDFHPSAAAYRVWAGRLAEVATA
jgi:lysophospholipase L1-like esterase